MHRLTTLFLYFFWLGPVCAAEIGVVGLFPGKAVLAVEGAPPKTYAVGSTLPGGSVLVAADSETATVLSNGKRQVLRIGEYVHRGGAGASNRVVLQADVRGHFIASGSINGSTVKMLVDTGASVVSLPASEAVRMGINYKNGSIAYTQTANGTSRVYKVLLDTVKIGDVELHGIEANVHESGLPITLLGMSFLNRMDMLREGEQMTLSKRY